MATRPWIAHVFTLFTLLSIPTFSGQSIELKFNKSDSYVSSILFQPHTVGRSMLVSNGTSRPDTTIQGSYFDSTQNTGVIPVTISHQYNPYSKEEISSMFNIIHVSAVAACVLSIIASVCTIIYIFKHGTKNLFKKKVNFLLPLNTKYPNLFLYLPWYPVVIRIILKIHIIDL